MKFSIFSLRPYHWSLLPIIFLAVLLLLPSLSASLIADDWWHYIWVQSIEEHPSPKQGALYDLFSFASSDEASRSYLISRGGLPWWASESLQVNFWRPIAELSHLDYRLFGLSTTWLHAHSIAWFVLLLLALYGFYQRIGLAKSAIITALLIVVTEPFHGITVSWLANRNILIAAFFVFVSLNSFLDSVSSKRPTLSFLSWLLFALALLASEAATSLLAFLFAYSLCLDDRSYRARIVSILPYLFITLAWLLLYRYLGFGASGNAAMYVDPVTKPVVFLQQLVERIPVAFSLQNLILPKLFPEFWDKETLVVVGVSLFLFAILVVFFSRSRLGLFALFSFALAVVPLASALLHERNFIFLSAAAAPLLALAITGLWRKKAYWSRLLAILLLFYKVVLGVLLSYLAIWYFASYINGQIIQTKNSLPDDLADKHVIVIGAPILHGGFVYPMRLAEEQAVPLSFYLLFSDNQNMEIEETAKGQWTIVASTGLLTESDKLLRDWTVEPFYQGQIVTLATAQLRVMEINHEGNIVEALLSVPTEKIEHTRLYAWSNNKLQLWEPHNPIVDNND